MCDILTNNFGEESDQSNAKVTKTDMPDMDVAMQITEKSGDNRECSCHGNIKKTEKTTIDEVTRMLKQLKSDSPKGRTVINMEIEIYNE